jgi:ribonuclease HII
VAKVARDAMISAWDPVFHAYKLASNKGYRSPDHLKALKQFGPSPLHRQSFYPVWNATSPQEVLEFMQEVEEEVIAEETEAPRKVRKGAKVAKSATA